MNYFLIEATNLIVRSDGACIPMDNMNMDYVAYLAWIAEGNTAEQWQPPTESVVE